MIRAFTTTIATIAMCLTTSGCDKPAEKGPKAVKNEPAAKTPDGTKAAKPTPADAKETSPEDNGPKGPLSETPAQRHTYYTNHTHNKHGTCEVEGCKNPNCACDRRETDPPDPRWPTQWVSEWTMYRVFKGWQEHPPPYASPPAPLEPGDYEASKGASYYDETYRAEHGTGAMMEFYEKRCLPIFPMSNEYTCAFISLGDDAYFLTYDDRPEDMPPCCRFSEDNHPPRPDFVRHLLYDPERSEHLGGSVQAYAIEVPAGPAKILFGYAFEKQARSDGENAKATPYQHPQSFYFSGSPTDPPNAPIVSQNYENFRAEQPDPAQTWQQVEQKCQGEIPWCCLFAGDCPNAAELGRSTPAPSWADMGRSPTP